MKKTKNKTVLVTGASKGIGREIAKVFCDGGYNVFICARNSELLRDTARQINAEGDFCADLTKASDCKRVVEDVVKAAGSIDILVNNAGDYVYSSVENTQEKDIDRLIDLNIKAPFLLTKYAVRYMKEKKWGRIINIGSISGVVGEANASLYSMTKSSLTGFTKALALELAQYNITVNTVNPGWVQTELAQEAVENSDFTYQEEIEMIPQKRFIQPYEIAALVKYIASEDAKGMTAQSVSLCAGLSAG